jgi:hypothetical protein
MKYKELRIGNLVSYEGDVYRINGIGTENPFLDTYRFGVGVVEWDDLIPVPIDESYLDSEFVETGRKQVGAMYIQFDNKGGIELRDYGNNLIKMIEYMHDLQNTYFAITGEEIELNIPEN